MSRLLPVLLMALAALPAHLWAKQAGSSSMSRPKTAKPHTSHPTAYHPKTQKPQAYKPQIPHPATYRPKTSKPATAKRTSAARTKFKHNNPCPSTGKSSGACPGYVIDHRQALKRGGADSPENMQWQTKAEAKAKDRVE